MTGKKSMYTLNHRYGDISPRPFDWLARIASAIARFWSQQRHSRLMRAELQTLDDRMLGCFEIAGSRVVYESSSLQRRVRDQRVARPTRAAHPCNCVAAGAAVLAHVMSSTLAIFV
jgi:hypothetical protein